MGNSTKGKFSDTKQQEFYNQISDLKSELDSDNKKSTGHGKDSDSDMSKSFTSKYENLVKKYETANGKIDRDGDFFKQIEEIKSSVEKSLKTDSDNKTESKTHKETHSEKSDKDTGKDAKSDKDTGKETHSEKSDKDTGKGNKSEKSDKTAESDKADGEKDNKQSRGSKIVSELDKIKSQIDRIIDKCEKGTYTEFSQETNKEGGIIKSLIGGNNKDSKEEGSEELRTKAREEVVKSLKDFKNELISKYDELVDSVSDGDTKSIMGDIKDFKDMIASEIEEVVEKYHTSSGEKRHGIMGAIDGAKNKIFEFINS